MRLFSKENVVCQVLDDLGDDHETSPHDEAVVLRYFHVDDLRSYNCGRDEAGICFEPEIQIWEET
jgi:hypothetical protein